MPDKNEYILRGDLHHDKKDYPFHADSGCSGFFGIYDQLRR